MTISRRDLCLGSAMAAALAATIGATAKGVNARAARPNILWLVSEDNNPYIGAYGDKIAHTPNLDALARKGVVYRNAFSTGPVCATSRFAILTGMHAESCAPAQHHRANAHLPPELKTYPELMREAGYYCTNNVKTDYNCDVDPRKIWDESSGKAQWYSRPDGKPFMAVYNYMTTHESQLFFETLGRVVPSDVRVPAYLPDSAEVRTDIASYYNLMEKMDSQVGDRLRQIEERGVADDTIIFYYSDNGGVLPRSKHYSYDEGYRCALIIYVPPKWRHLAPATPGSVIEAPISYVDFAPTLLSLIGRRKLPHMQGRALMGPFAEAPLHYAFGARDRMDERYDLCRTVTDGRYRLIRNYLRDRPAAGHEAYAWQMKSYQDWERRHLAGQLKPVQDRFFLHRPYEEFYDTKSDPDETHDLMADPHQLGRITAMQRALDAQMMKVNDNGFIPEGDALEGYFPSRAPGAYPLARIMALAALAARCDPRHIPALRAALADDNAVIRYWGAVGLRFLGAHAKAARDDLEKRASTDPSVHVRIGAGEALVHAGGASDAVPRLGAILAETDASKPVRLQALDALTYIGPEAKAALPQIRTASTASDNDIQCAATYLLALLEGTYRPDMQIYRAGPNGPSKAPLPPPPL